MRVICLNKREGGLGLTLRGDSPVLVAGVVPGGWAEVRYTVPCTSREDSVRRKDLLLYSCSLISILFLSSQKELICSLILRFKYFKTCFPVYLLYYYGVYLTI